MPARRWPLLVVLLGAGCATRTAGRVVLRGEMTHREVEATPAEPTAAARTPTVPTAACLPVDGVPIETVRLADRLLLEAGDGEALYTLAGGLKPLSSGRAFSFAVDPAPAISALDSLDAMRRAARLLACGEIGAFVHVFTATSGDSIRRRSAELVVHHRGAVARTVQRHAAFFGTLGITPAADAREVLAAVENAPRADRWRGYGLLFGYPEDAVDFFVRAGLAGDSTRTIAPRDFRRIETYRKFAAERDGPPVLSTFVYAVPKGSPESPADRALREASAPIYARYRQERARGITPDSAGALTLWRRWLSAP
ncbi:MAG: hypothetical protein ACFLMY_13830 [Candidatus Brachytrichaceae bacterium NZ_4S206]